MHVSVMYNMINSSTDIPNVNVSRRKEEWLSKRYTPIPDESGLMKLLVKVYKPCDNFPDGGKVSQYIDSIQIGGDLSIKYPYGKVLYEGNGKFLFKY